MTAYRATPKPPFRAAIFDLDGVLVDTARYHYLAWKRLAAGLGFDFTERDNERLKGVSRMESLEILLEISGISVSHDGKLVLADRKNQWYVEAISTIGASDALPGAIKCLTRLNQASVPIALASASKNAPLVVERLRLAGLFQYIVDVRQIMRAKPDPDIFLNAAEGLGVRPAQAVVFEDAPAGLWAAHAAGMYAVGVGNPEVLRDADLVVTDLAHVDIGALFSCPGG